jgi:glycosyltransferase involved in cell wall biosynthesis
MLRIIVPAYNEEARIARTIREYSDYFGDRARICVVANGCTDRTVGIVSKLIELNLNLELIEIPFAIGKGGAVRVGLMSGSEEFVGFTDADGSTPPDSFAKLFDTCKVSGTDAAIGSRWMRGSMVSSKQPLFRRAASRAFNACVRLLFGLKFADTQCGCKIFRRSALKVVIPNLELSNFAFDIDLLYALKAAGFVTKEVPVSWADNPGSKVRVATIWFTLAIGLFRLRLRTGPFRTLPYLDLLARPNVIEVKDHFKILIVCFGGLNAEDRSKIESWGARVRESGHSVRLYFANSALERCRFFAWYFRRGNVVYDLVVDSRDNLPGWFSLISAKARVGSEAFELDDVDDVLHHLPSYFGYSQFIFDRSRDGWQIIGGTPRVRIGLSKASKT